MTHVIDPAILDRAADAVGKMMSATLSYTLTKEESRVAALAALQSAIPEAIEAERVRCVAEINRLHMLVSVPSPFNSDILAIESKREAYELAAEMVAVMAFPWESERDQITRAAHIRARSAQQNGGDDAND